MRIALFFHLLGIAVWIGGMTFAHFALRPAAALLPPPQRLPLMAAALGRFFPLAGVAVVAVLLSGTALMHALGGTARAGFGVTAMMAIGLVMTLVYSYIVLAPYRRFKAAVAASSWEAAGAALAQVRGLVTLNLALGVLVIALATLAP